MKKTLIALLFVIASTFVFAQQEELTPLTINPSLYHTYKKNTAGNHRYLIDKGITIIKTDTLSLPFVDDFSSNSLTTLNWYNNHRTDTFYNVFGTCLSVEGVPISVGYFMNTTSWSYSFDTVAQKVDSAANPSVSFTFFGPAPSGCFNQPPQSFTYWNIYYTYKFDSISGRAIDSTLVRPTDTIYYAPVIYFANAEQEKFWVDNYAYVNNTYPVNPPTIGVATLDGLNEYGLPYNNSSNHTYGTADYLTSKPINLSGLTESDSLYISFFYEGMGLGDFPDKDDSLLLEFRDNSSEWRTVWCDTGYASLSLAPNKFKEVLVKIPSLSIPYTYYYPTFQFRFRNKASLYGNDDHWHIDYVKLDKNRSAYDTLNSDIAFIYPFPTILKNYTLLPADQFNYPPDLCDTISIPVHNMDINANNNPPATDFSINADEIYPTTAVVLNNTVQTFNAAEYSYLQVNPASQYNIPITPNWPVDSLIISTQVYIRPNDARPQNDTLRHVQRFDYTMAYDDGSAERAYGLTGVGLKKFAYEFALNQSDTLTAFQVQYSQVEEDVSSLVFNFYAWDSLEVNNISFDDEPHVIFTLDNQKPFYIDSLNGFTTYKLDTPIIVSGKVYFGWVQTDTRRLQIGYDLNSKLGRNHMFIFTGATWKKSTVTPDGSPMIRLIFDSNFWGNSTTSIKDLSENDFSVEVFPNPATDVLNIRNNNRNANLDASIFNMIGEVVYREQNVQQQINIGNLSRGVYWLILRNKITGKSVRKKIIITR